MKLPIVTLCCLFIVSSAAMNAADNAVSGKNQPVAQQTAQQDANTENYQLLAQSRVICLIGGAPPARIDDLFCKTPSGSKFFDIALLSHGSPDGIVKTKKFGTIKFVRKGSKDVSMWMKPSDAAKLERYLKKG